MSVLVDATPVAGEGSDVQDVCKVHLAVARADAARRGIYARNCALHRREPRLILQVNLHVTFVG